MHEFAQFLQELSRLFERMDRAYEQAAERHGFVCGGCEDNCCETRFYHHTLIEFLYLNHGLALLPADQRERIVWRAGAAVQAMDAADGSARPVPVMCPLNEAQRCRLYAYRPMICRLHGIPHQLRRPDGQRLEGPGCGDFDRRCGRSNRIFLDRTPLYAALADLEKRSRRQCRFEGKIKLTVAQMLTRNVEGLVAACLTGDRHEIC
jgi:Fe-S-cluster containining protein